MQCIIDSLNMDEVYSSGDVVWEVDNIDISLMPAPLNFIQVLFEVPGGVSVSSFCWNSARLGGRAERGRSTEQILIWVKIKLLTRQAGTELEITLRVRIHFKNVTKE